MGRADAPRDDPPRSPLRRPLRGDLHGRPRSALRSLPLRRVRGAPATRRLGSEEGNGPRAREIRREKRDDALERLRADHGLDGLAAENLLMYLDEQLSATGAIPDDRTIVIERFPDEIGDWRVCVLTPFGARVHAPWAMAIEARLAERDMEVQLLWSDDGIVIR